ncbi:hypothetical protein [Pectobacterium aroidearum]|uniref:hypothetical protein n=1 Tax=Pectobacterium aroidearum TaxID=1201031 RepID=UPI0032EE4F6A
MQNLMPPVDTPDKAFHDGNPLTGELGTIVTAKFMNDVQAAIRNSQAEIISVLADAGIAIDPNKTDQLLTALKATFATNSNMNGRVPSTRTVNGKALSADITLNAGDVGALSAAGTAVAATKLATARNINGVPFDGTTNITLSAAGVGALARSENGADIQDKAVFARNAQVPHLGNTWIEFGGSAGAWTTSQFIGFLDEMGAFDHGYFVCAGSWSFSANKKIADTNCGHIELAGAIVEVFASRFNLRTVRVTTMSSSSDPSAVQGQFVYVESITPGSGEWRREFNTKTLTASDIDALPKNGTAVAASKLATARTINGVPFDGTANIELTPRVWMSSEFTPASNTPIIATHGLSGINPLNCRCDVLVKCVEADGGYQPGDFAINPATLYMQSDVAHPYTLIPALNSSTIQVNMMTHLSASLKTSTLGNQYFNMSKWRVIIRIFY